MANQRFPDKAQITFSVDGQNSTLRFHSVMVEEHTLESEVTKYPVQSGFEVSNHAIRKNRKVSITGIVSNHLLTTQDKGTIYDTNNNQKFMFDALRNVIQSAVPCEVLTNLGSYSPVIFTRFKTKQEAGLIDAMVFTISGEEIRLADGVNSTTPTPLVFTPLRPEAKDARLEELHCGGFDVDPKSSLSEAIMNIGESFQVDTVSLAGAAVLSTYEAIGFDASTNTQKYKVHTSDISVHDGAGDESSFNWFGLLEAEESGLPDLDVAHGLNVAGACLNEGAANVVTEGVGNYVDTALGTLKKSVYGASYDIMGVNGDRSFGQELLSMGVDCMVAGVTGAADPCKVTGDEFDQSPWPSADDILDGAASIGDRITTTGARAFSPTTLTKISGGSDTSTFFGDLL